MYWFVLFETKAFFHAGWIHGIEGNPIAELARRNNLDLHVVPSETVIYGPDGKAVNQDEDERVEKLFNKLLEKARKVCEHMLR